MKTDINGRYEQTYSERASRLQLRANPPDSLAAAELQPNSLLNKDRIQAISDSQTISELQKKTHMYSHEIESALGGPRTADHMLTFKEKKQLLHNLTSKNAEYVMYKPHRPTVDVNGKPVNMTSTQTTMNGGEWIHSRPVDADVVMADVQKRLVPEILDPNTSKSQALDKLADLHWRMAQSMPFERGSATIADWYVESLAQAKGIKLSGWKPGVGPDLEALTLSRSQFVERYPSLFERPP